MGRVVGSTCILCCGASHSITHPLSLSLSLSLSLLMTYRDGHILWIARWFDCHSYAGQCVCVCAILTLKHHSSHSLNNKLILVQAPALPFSIPSSFPFPPSLSLSLSLSLMSSNKIVYRYLQTDLQVCLCVRTITNAVTLSSPQQQPAATVIYTSDETGWQPMVTPLPLLSTPPTKEIPKESIIANTDFTTTSAIAKR